MDIYQGQGAGTTEVAVSLSTGTSGATLRCHIARNIVDKKIFWRFDLRQRLSSGRLVWKLLVDKGKHMFRPTKHVFYLIYFHNNSPSEAPQVETSRSFFVYFRQLQWPHLMRMGVLARIHYSIFIFRLSMLEIWCALFKSKPTINNIENTIVLQWMWKSDCFFKFFFLWFIR